MVAPNAREIICPGCSDLVKVAVVADAPTTDGLVVLRAQWEHACDKEPEHAL